jgi:hypothetical protein
MRRIDKKLNMMKANLLAESRYLESKGLIKEGVQKTDSDIDELATEIIKITKGDETKENEAIVNTANGDEDIQRRLTSRVQQLKNSEAINEIENQGVVNEFFGFGGFKKESVYPYIGELKKLLLPSTPLTIEMAEKAPNSINKFNQIVDEIKADKGIVKKMGKKGISLKTTLGTYEYGINRASDNYNSDMNDLYLGNVGGLYTKPLSFWVRNIDDAEVANTIGKQLSGWVNSNIKHVIEVLTSLTKD